MMSLKEDYSERTKKITYDLVQFFEEYKNEEGKAKYKEIIDNYIKDKGKENKISLEDIKELAMNIYGELLNDLKKYDKRLARKAEQMRLAIIKILTLYFWLRVQLLKGLLGVELKKLNEFESIFITQKFIDESGIKDEVTLQELKEIFMGYVTEINGDQTLVVRFWVYALAFIIHNFTMIDLPGRAYVGCFERLSLEDDGC